MSRLGEKHQPVYSEGKPCRKCGTTIKIQVFRIRPRQKNNVIYYKAIDIERVFGKVGRIKTIRCKYCCNAQSIKKNLHNDTLEWQRENREHLRDYQRKYYKGKYAARNAKNNKRIKERYVYNDMEEIQEFYRNCPKDFHVDHIIPLNGKNVSGLHTVNNLQYLSATDNLRKHNKFIIQ